MNYHGLPYIMSNLTTWTISMLKNFSIRSCIRERDMVYRFTLGMKHPVVYSQIILCKDAHEIYMQPIQMHNLTTLDRISIYFLNEVLINIFIFRCGAA